MRDILKYLYEEHTETFERYSKQMLGKAVMYENSDCIKFLLSDAKLSPEILKNTTAYEPCKDWQKQISAEEPTEVLLYSTPNPEIKSHSLNDLSKLISTDQPTDVGSTPGGALNLIGLHPAEHASLLIGDSTDNE